MELAVRQLFEMIWPLTLAVFFVFGILAFRGARWAYFTFVGLGLLVFPARVGFHFQPQPCELALNVPLALFSLTNYGHVVLWAIFFMMTAVQLRRYGRHRQFLIAAAAALAMGIYVELAEGVTGRGHCRLRDLVPDSAGAALGAIAVLALPGLRNARSGDTEDG